jgi:hypothetical protein
MSNEPEPIRVEGVPPKKDGANSMWRKGAELDRLKRLRRGALERFKGAPAPAAASVSIHLRVLAPASSGDLDNFVAGVCDGLQAAHPLVRRWIDPAAWEDVPSAARPDRPVAFENDASINRITAERVDPGGDGPSYEVIVAW